MELDEIDYKTLHACMHALSKKREGDVSMVEKTREVEARMNRALRQLDILYRVKWLPDSRVEASNRGSINVHEKVITIRDRTEDQAWTTLIHEILELKLRPFLSLYRELVNTLIAFIEKHVYNEKERLLESLPTSLPTILKHIEEARNGLTEH